MGTQNFDTVSAAVDALTKAGYIDSFKAGNNCIQALYAKKEYMPEDLHIIETHRFEGMTDPEDESAVFAIEAPDGIKGTMVMSYSAEHNQNEELIRRIRYR